MVHAVKELSRREIKSLAEDYANSDDILSIGVLARKNGVTESVFRTSIRIAIVKGLVSDEVVDEIINKATRNTAVKGGEKRTQKYYAGLKLLRKKYHFSREEARSLIKGYIKERYPYRAFAEKIVINPKFMLRAFQESITDGYLNNYEMDELYELLCKDPSPEALDLVKLYDCLKEHRRLKEAFIKGTQEEERTREPEQLSLFESDRCWPSPIKKEYRTEES